MLRLSVPTCELIPLDISPKKASSIRHHRSFLSTNRLFSNGGEYPRGFIVRKEGHVSATELHEMIKSHFAPHKWLTGGIYFIDSVPRTGSGKVVRRNLPSIEGNLKPIRGRL